MSILWILKHIMMLLRTMIIFRIEGNEVFNPTIHFLCLYKTCTSTEKLKLQIMRNKLIIALFLFAFKSFAQIATNHLFIIIDNKDGIQKTESRKLKGNDKDGACIEKTNIYKEHREIELIYESGKTNKIYKYFYVNEPKNWQISFSFNHYANGGTINNFILMLPKERFEEIARERYYANYLETL